MKQREEIEMPLCPKCLKAELVEEEDHLRCPKCGAILYWGGESVYPKSEEEYILWQ